MKIIGNAVLTLLGVTVLVNCSENERPLVTIQDGSIRGTFKKSLGGRKYMAFEGIPFAQPPIGDLRFMEPEPAKPWSGVLDANSSYICIQVYLSRKIRGQEDCLYMYVYIPREKLNPNEKLKVVAHIHGGAFMMGNPRDYGGESLIMDRDVIFVSFNYRVGAMGFLGAGSKVVRGNLGLKDQAAALRWIQKNIEKFGGDKDSVTLTGTSSGSVCVHLHYLGNYSRGLFHRGFAQSGVALNPWPSPPHPALNVKKLASKIGCLDENIEDVYKCLAGKSTLQIMGGVQEIWRNRTLPSVLFGPTKESYMPTAFLVATPYSLLVSKDVYDVPLFMSITTEEGTIEAARFYNLTEELNEHWNELLPQILAYYTYDQEKRDDISVKIKQFYFHDRKITKENFGEFVELCSHRLFHLGAEKAARLQANATTSDVYFLKLGYAGENTNVIPGIGNIGNNVTLGVGHGMDAKFYYNIPHGIPKIKNEEEVRMKDMLLDMLEAYAKTGKPVINGVNFEPVSKSGNLKYLSIYGPDNISMKSIETLGPHEFWRSLELEEDENVHI